MLRDEKKKGRDYLFRPRENQLRKKTKTKKHVIFQVHVT